MATPAINAARSNFLTMGFSLRKPQLLGDSTPAAAFRESREKTAP
jgi:hypothetical protein